MDVRDYNRDAWDREVARGNRWTVPVTSDEVARARAGDWQIVLTPTVPVPASWFPPLKDCDVLCLASGGGQQGPLLAAAGARVTVLDNSPAQLAQDRAVAERDGLELITIEGDMASMPMLADDSFDLIVHPVANCFAPEVRPVWAEAFRVLRRGGALLAGFTNPDRYLFDDALLEGGEFVLRHALPYSDLTSLDEEERSRYIDAGLPLVFGHTLDEQIGGQLDAGFLIAGFYEDHGVTDRDPLSEYMATCLATRAVKP